MPTELQFAARQAFTRARQFYKGGFPLTQDSWVVDVWASVFCRPRHYTDWFRQKMAQWSRQGKLVNHRGTLMRAAGPFADIHTRSRVVCYDPGDQYCQLG